MENKNIVAGFIEKAKLVSAVVHEVSDVDEAIKKAVAICRDSEKCENLYPEKNIDYEGKLLAAPGLDLSCQKVASGLCEKESISFVTQDIRQYPGGIDTGLTFADYGIAETGTLVINSDSEDIRLASMLCETHVAILDKSDIKETAMDMAQELGDMTNPVSSYTAFVTGASRTADIERVLALGVHGPLELHIILTGNAPG